jgi:hypothetical protein
VVEFIGRFRRFGVSWRERKVAEAAIDSWEVEELLAAEASLVMLIQGGMDLKPRRELTYM